MTATRIKKLFIASLIFSSAVSLSACAHERHADQRWQAEYGDQRQTHRKHDYIYYPAQQVYFSPSKNNWFWAGGSGWQVATRLPSHLSVDLRFGGVPLSLRATRPYVEHAYVESSYGRPWRESHRNWRDHNDRGHHERHEVHHNRRHHEHERAHAYQRWHD